MSRARPPKKTEGSEGSDAPLRGVKRKPVYSAIKRQKKEKPPSPMKRSAAPAKAPSKGLSTPAVTKESGNVSLRLAQACKAVDEARREGVVTSIQRCLTDPLVGIEDLEDVLVRLHRVCEARRLELEKD